MKYTQFQGSNPFGSQAKMLYHVDRIAEYKQTGDTRPVFIEFNLTDKCNLRCKWCISENCRSLDTIPFNTAYNFLKEFRAFGGKAITFSGGGEPTQHPDFDRLLEHAFALGLDCGLMTNGVFNSYNRHIIADRCKWVRISLDTTNGEKYKKWKGIDKTAQVIENLKYLYQKTKVGINCNIGMEHTIDDIESLMALQHTCDYIQFRPILPRYYNAEDVQVNYEVWEYLRLNYSNHPKVNMSDDKFTDLVTSQTFPFTSCEGHFFNPVVQANGDVTVCMYHPKDDRFVFGNLNKDTFENIWRSEKRKQIIKDLRKFDYKKECQICCKLTELNKFMDFLNHPDPKSDINFL